MVGTRLKLKPSQKIAMLINTLNQNITFKLHDRIESYDHVKLMIQGDVKLMILVKQVDFAWW